MLQSCIQWRQHVIRIDAHDDKTGILDSIIKRGEADAEPLTHTHRTSLVHVTNCTQQHRGCGSEALTTVVQSRSDTPVQRRVTSFELRALHRAVLLLDHCDQYDGNDTVQSGVSTHCTATTLSTVTALMLLV
eukprot:17539-Heterococcus_DN1.PRE.2